MRRLLALEYCFCVLSLDPAKHEALILCAGPKLEQRRKAEQILAIIDRGSFWADLKMCVDDNHLYCKLAYICIRVKSHLEPFAIATNIAQTDFACLHIILLTMANLYCIFSSPQMDPAVRDGDLASLEKRWANADQDIFILCLILNPYIRTDAFHPNSPFRTMNGVWPIFRAAYVRMYDVEPDLECQTALSQHLQQLGNWTDESMSLKEHEELANKSVHHFSYRN